LQILIYYGVRWSFQLKLFIR